MKLIKFFSVFAVCALLLAPSALMAKTSFNFSINLFDAVAPYLAPRPIFVAPARPPVVHYFVPCPPPVPQQKTIVKEYHYYYPLPQNPACEITVIHPPTFVPIP